MHVRYLLTSQLLDGKEQKEIMKKVNISPFQAVCLIILVWRWVITVAFRLFRTFTVRLAINPTIN